MIITSENNLTVNAPKTYLTTTLNAGTNVIPWKTPAGFNASWAIQLGDTGEAQAEIVILGASSPSGTAGTTTANTLYPHAADSPIYGIKFDQIVFERSTTGTAGTATPITGGTSGIMPMGTTTFFDDTSGASTYAYKTYFRASVLAVNSSESDWITTTGFPFFSLGKMRQRVKDKLTSSGYISGINVDDSAISDWLNEWLEVMNNTAQDVNEDWGLGTTQIVFSASVQLGTITNSDFKGQLKRVWQIVPGGTFQATKMDSNSFSPNKTFTDTYPYFFMQGDNVIGRAPYDSAGTLQIEYPNLITVLVNDADTLPVSMQGYTKSFVDYAHAQALFKDQKIEESVAKLKEATDMLARFKTDISPRNKTGVTYQDIVEDTSADQELWL